jgi:hypothetical protein
MLACNQLAYHPPSTCLHVVALQCLFLHADTALPSGFGQLITDAVSARDKLQLPPPPPSQQQLVQLPGPLQAVHSSWQWLWGQQPQHYLPCASRKQPSQQVLQSGATHQPAVWGCFSSIQLDQVRQRLLRLVCSWQAGSHFAGLVHARASE